MSGRVYVIFSENFKAMAFLLDSFRMILPKKKKIEYIPNFLSPQSLLFHLP